LSSYFTSPNGRIVAGIFDLYDATNLAKEKLLLCEVDGAARLEQINALTALLKASESDRAARLEQINTLADLLKISESDRAARLEKIHELEKMLRDA
jgi:hypothetical protein